MFFEFCFLSFVASAIYGIQLVSNLFNRIMKLRIIIVTLAVLINACGTRTDPQKIIDMVIQNHGGDRYENVRVSFDFRGRHYILLHKNGFFQYERHFSNSTGEIKDVLNNQGFKRYLDQHDITDTVKKAASYARSVNSVAYFALLPYRLNDPAVNKSYLGTGEIKKELYHKILITFDQEKGGDDYSDQFVYWIHAKDLTMEYFAYLYYTDGGGKRFRAPINVRTVGGIRFADYENYRQTDDSIKVHDYDKEYNQGRLELLSKIELENLDVQAL